MTAKKPLEYSVHLGGQTFLVRVVHGEERISAPFRFECIFRLPAGVSVDPDAVVSRDVVLALDREDTVRRVTGIVSDVWLSATATGVPELTLIIEPRFAMMRFREDLRLFREKTAVQIVCDVLAGHGIAPELCLADTYVVRHYCVQLRETDLDFVHRMLEDEGIFYFFREDGTLVLGDRASVYGPIPGDPILPFRPGLGLDVNDDCVTEIGARATLLPGEVSLRDFNPEHPSLDMDVSAPGPTPGGPEHYDFPGEYLLPDQGRIKAQKRAEALACAALVHVGASFSGRLVPGSTFDLALAPPGVDDGGYVVTRVVHDHDAERQGFSVSFEALRADVSFRPLVETDAPTLTNPITGFVTGAPGEDIHCDEYGRVKVHFHWDRLFPRDDTCSYWIPVLQDNTGHSGSIPRVGWEVLVHFLEGDPDRPVVVGRVYNPRDPHQVVLPDSKTRSTIKSISSPREEVRDESGVNEIHFEDLQGFEFLQYHAQKDQNVAVANSKTETVQTNQESTIERDEQIRVDRNHTATIGSNLVGQVKRDQTHHVGGSRKVSVGEAFANDVAGNRTLTIGADHVRTIKADDTALAQADNTETVKANVVETSKQENTTRATRTSKLTVGGDYIETAKRDKNESVGISRVEEITGDFTINADGEIGLRTNKTRTSDITGALRVSAVKAMTLTGTERFLTESLTAAITGPGGVHLKVGETQVILKDGALQVDAKTDIKLTISGSNDQGASKGSQI